MTASSTWVDLLSCEVRRAGARYHTRVITCGSGTPLLLLHGTGGHAENYVRNIVPLAAARRVIAPDFLWHGASSTDGFEAGIIPKLVDQIIDLMDSEGIAEADIEGQSLGGWVAATLAMQHPDRVRRLVLTVPIGYRPDPGVVEGWVPPDFTALREASLDCLRNPTWDNLRKRVERIVHDPATLTDEAIAIRHKLHQDPATNAAQRLVITHYLGGEAPQRWALTDAALATITAPTLVYWGEFNLTPASLGARMAQVIPNARFHCAPATGQWAQYENHDEHNTVVLAFLTSQILEQAA